MYVTLCDIAANCVLNNGAIFMGSQASSVGFIYSSTSGDFRSALLLALFTSLFSFGHYKY